MRPGLPPKPPIAKILSPCTATPRSQRLAPMGGPCSHRENSKFRESMQLTGSDGSKQKLPPTAKILPLHVAAANPALALGSGGPAVHDQQPVSKISVEARQAPPAQPPRAKSSPPATARAKSRRRSARGGPSCQVPADTVMISTVSRQPSPKPPTTKIQFLSTAAPNPRRGVAIIGPLSQLEVVKSRTSVVSRGPLPSKPPRAKTTSWST
mmetsp:Transcript_14442/g.46248  ORF Transcript_14442/g.46248 Transcript_14442/m.46248 type:complete len:210 (-) Transcript_14442:96-725(-)